MTDAENRLWMKLRGKQLNNFQFYRQKIIGNYIVDFYCAKANLIIELDGGQHYNEEDLAKDILGLRWFAFLQSGLAPVNADKYLAIICNSIIYH